MHRAALLCTLATFVAASRPGPTTGGTWAR